MALKHLPKTPAVVVEPVISVVNTPHGVYGKKTLPFNDGSVFPIALSKSVCVTSSE